MSYEQQQRQQEQPKVTLISADTAELGVKNPPVTRVSTSATPIQASKLVVPIIVGTRPEAIKLVPIIRRLAESDHYQPLVVSTGQHQRMVAYIFELAGIKPDVVLWAGSKRSQLNERVASVMQRFEDFCAERFEAHPDGTADPEDILNGRFPAAVLVHGDTTSAMSAALSAFHLRIPVMHVEAGLRTGGNNLTPFPEELNRQLISCIAGLHFAPTAKNLENLVRENIPIGQIFVTGNTGIDALQWASTIDVKFANPMLQALHDSDKRVVVITAHRRENWGEGLKGIAEGVRRLAAAEPEVHFVLPLHPNPAVRETLATHLANLDNVLLTEPLGYATFARLLARTHLVITDSGGIQEEAPSLGKPVLVARETTERTEGVEAGTLRLVGNDPDKIFTEGDRLLNDPVAYAEMAEAANPYGDGLAADRIVRALEHVLLGGDPPAPFGPGYSRAEIARAAGFDLPAPALSPDLDPTEELDPAELEAVGEYGGGVTLLALQSPFAGLPDGIQVLFWFALIVIIGVDLWTVTLFVRGCRTAPHDAEAEHHAAARFTWVFLVPALNEEVTIRDSVERLLQIPVKKRHIVVIDDASDDRTPEILAEIHDPDLHVIRRELPEARIGKAAGLNHAYAGLAERLGAVDRAEVIVVIVDADGRLALDAPEHVATHFADPAVGGVQSLVRIYNRQSILAWFQDVEFGVYGHLYQAGRNDWGTAGMGGNGQFNRLSALDDIADQTGPWRDRLTEDQDLGLRLIGRGWEGRQELRATVDQQGLPKLRPLLRQRTRWSQGNLQAVRLVGELVHAPFTVGARLELMAYLFMPLWQGIIGLTFLTAIALTVFDIAPFWNGGPTWQLLFFYALAFGGTILGCIAARRSEGPKGWLMGFLIGNLYTFYTWLLWPVLLRSTMRQITKRDNWAKTEREAIEAAPDAAEPPAELPRAA